MKRLFGFLLLVTALCSCATTKAAVTARLAQPAPLTPEEIAALADATAKATALAAVVSQP